MEIRLRSTHQITVTDVETVFGNPGGGPGKHPVTNYQVRCACGWVAASRFRSKVAAQVTGKEHGDQVADLGFCEFVLRGLTKDEAGRWRI